MKKKFIFLFLVLPLFIIGQNREVPINISLFNEATAIPYTQFITVPFHPGIQLGTEFNYKTKGHSRLFQTASINYFYHNHLNQGIGLYSEFGYEYRIQLGLAFSGLFGLGYMHTFATAEEFSLTNGQYESRPDRGNPRLFPSFSLDIGYYLNSENQYSPKIFIRYQSWAEYPFSPGFIPVMTHINLHVGVKFFIKSKKSTNEKS